jgi:hypothetical protein
MIFSLPERSVRILSATVLTCVLALLSSCGGGSTADPPTGALSGNWQLTLVQSGTKQPIQFSLSGFLQQSSNSLTGSFVLPGTCAGAGPVTGTVNGQSINLSVDQSGSTLELTGNTSSDNRSMAGAYTDLAGGCSKTPSTGTWSAILIPPLTGNFTGTLSNSFYMGVVTGVTPPAPIAVSGTITQSPNMGSSNASLSGTITATNYPCFSTAALTGTVTGQNVDLTVYGLGPQIGYIGQNPIATTSSTAAVLSVGTDGLSLTGSVTGGSATQLASGNGLILGSIQNGNQSGPCPKLLIGVNQIEDDFADVTLTFH